MAMAESTSPQGRRISFYRLMEKQRSDLLDSGRFPLRSGSISEASSVDAADGALSNFFFRVIQPEEGETPSARYDVVIVLPKKGFTILGPLTSLLSRLLPQLTVDRKTFLQDASKTALLVSADEGCLVQTAKLTGIISQDDDDDDDSTCHVFSSPTQLTSEQRQTLIKYYLDSLRFFPKNGKVDIPGVTLKEGDAIISKLIKLKMIEGIFPLHSKHELNYLRSSWVTSVFSSQPLDRIQEYFGVKIGKYFAFLGHYTSWLTAPSLLGSLVFLSGFFVSQPIVDLSTLLFSIFVFLWSTLYLESLRTRCDRLADKWCVSDSHHHHQSSTSYILSKSSYGIRSDFVGKVRYDEDTDTVHVEYPEWKRNLTKYAVSLPVITACLVMLFAVIFYIVKFQTYWDKVLIGNHGYPSWTSYLPKVAFAVIVPILDGVFFRIAVILNNMENYAYEVIHENQLVSKTVIFQFTNSFLSLFYLAFYVGDMDKLQEQLAAFITRQILGNLEEAVWPFVHQSFLVDKKISIKTNDPKKTDDKEDMIIAAEEESLLNVYESTYDDYLEMFLQFGNVVLFSSTFPLAALCALFNNIIEIRSDAFKLCVTHQRPFAGSRVKDTGEEWFQAMNLLVYSSVIVNCALLVKSGLIERLFPSLDAQHVLAAVLVMIGLKVLMDKKKHLPFFGRLLMVPSPCQQ